MKQKILTLFLALLPFTLSAQTLVVNESLRMLENSQADVQYNNEFGDFRNDEVDDAFPFVVVKVEVEGDVQQAKQMLSLDMGTNFKVEAKNINKDNMILFLIRSSARSIFMQCGDGCQAQQLYYGGLIANKVYVCHVTYTAKKTPAAESEDIGEMKQQMEEIRRQNEEMKKMLTNMQQNQQNQQNESVKSVKNQYSSEEKEVANNSYQNSQSLDDTYTVSDDRLVYKDYSYYLDGKKVSTAELQELYKNYCPTEFAKYKKAKAADVTGEVFIAVGGVVCTVGLICLIPESTRTAGLGMTIGGMVVCFGIGLPVKLCNKSTQRFNECMEAYNSRYRTARNDKEVTLNFQASQDGLGIAFRF